MLSRLSPYATVNVIYPYGKGTENTDKIRELIKDVSKANPIYTGIFKVLPSSTGSNSLGSIKAAEILGICPTANNIPAKITLIGYSGGSQVAYSAAQALQGDLFVENVVAMGPTFRAYNQMTNIGNLWELVGENDDLTRLADILWQDINSGKTVEYHDGPGVYGRYSDVYKEALDIYKLGATRCVLLGTKNSPYVHHGSGDYFDFDIPTGGTICGGDLAMSYAINASVTKSSRGQAIVDLLVKIIGIGR